MNSSTISQKEISLFFFPLVLNVQLMSVSHSIINAALARQTDFITALAGFSVAMVLHLFFASPSYQNHTITIAMVRGRQSLKGVTIFALLVASYVSFMLALVAFTPVGEFLLLQVLGVTEEVAAEARGVLSLLVFLPFFTGFRGIAQGLVIQARRTVLVSLATGVRIGGLLLFVWLGQRWFSGGRLGAFGLLCCVALESLLVGFFASRVHFPATGEEEKSAGEILRYAFPLAYSSCLQQTIPLMINAVISRLPDGTLALASFGIIRGFLFLLAGPMRNLQQAYLTLVKTAADWKVLVKFSLRTACGMAAVMLLIAYPLNGLVMGRIMGLKGTMQSYIALPLAFCALYPLLYGAANLLRGYFAGAHRTALLGTSTIYKSIYLLLAWGLCTLWPPPLPGIAVAIVLLLSSELCEASYLNRQRRLLSTS